MTINALDSIDWAAMSHAYGLHRMGPAAAPALPGIRTELTLLRRSGRFGGVANDEDLQDACRAVISDLTA
ncbi:hypothetical protein [Streptomyces sp. NPDC093105]|uniref:hypothetical protein n=1 Tax=Streptomyces sp. NPDC093105 TaxID=3366029 RepID=UPI0038155BD6